jgi:hypothetical protein
LSDANSDIAASSEPPIRRASAEPSQSVELVFWESIKDSTRLSDYEDYLEQYPDGSFVTLARTRLAEFSSAGDREVELSFWESVRESNNPATLRAYLEKYPDGEFKSLAEIRPSELAGSRSGAFG